MGRFFGGVPTKVDVQKLIDEIGLPEPGVVILHAGIESILGINRNKARYKTVVERWRKALFSEHNHYLVSVRGRGFEVADPTTRIRTAHGGLKMAARKIFRSGEIAARTDRAALKPEDAKIADHVCRVSAARLLAGLTRPQEQPEFDWSRRR